MAVTIELTISDRSLAILKRALEADDQTYAAVEDSSDRTFQTNLDPNYDQATCSLFLKELGVSVVQRSAILFETLASEGKIDSVQLAGRLGLDGPTKLPGSLTTPLKRRAAFLGLPNPFDGGLGTEMYGGISNPAPGDDPERTHWADREGIAARMVDAIRAELGRRSVTVGDRVLEAVTAEPGLTDRALRERLGINHQHANQEARALENKGLVERRTRPDGTIGTYPTTD